MNLEYIKWRDCVSCGGWQGIEEMNGWGDDRIIKTVGFVTYESEHSIVLAQSLGDAGQGSIGCNWLSIPKAIIIQREILFCGEINV